MKPSLQRNHAVRALLIPYLLSSACQPSPVADGEDREPPMQQAPAPAERATRDAGYIGVVIARAATELAADMDGRIVDTYVEPGDRVEPGDAIVLLDTRAASDELAMARAALRSASAVEAEARVVLEQAQRDAARASALAEHGVSAAAEREQAELALQRAVAAVERARADAAHSQARIDALARRVAAARITAPFPGTIAMRHVERGTMVSAGTEVARLIASELRVRFAIPAQDVALMARGDAVVVDIESGAVRVDGDIQYIAPELDPASQMTFVEARLNIAGSSHALVRAGQACTVRLRAQLAAPSGSSGHDERGDGTSRTSALASDP